MLRWYGIPVTGVHTARGSGLETPWDPRLELTVRPLPGLSAPLWSSIRVERHVLPRVRSGMIPTAVIQPLALAARFVQLALEVHTRDCLL
jgi:hypothetical protein